ncbi:MAG: 23S rRNA (uracil(1939)-C(5))-methyltransferase RlmD [Bacilli bacterium]
MEKNEMKNVKIIALDHQGRGIAKEAKPIFISNALIGETVDIKITKEKKNFMEGQVLSTIIKSNDRREYNCPYYKECGGCDIGHLNYNEQLKYKQNKIIEILKKFADKEIDENIVKSIIPSNEQSYRNKITLQVNEQMGYYKKKSYNIIPINNCLIASPKINTIINLIQNKIDLKNIYQIVIRTSEIDSMIIFRVNGKVDFEKIVKILQNEVKSIVKYENNEYKNILGKGYILENICDLEFKISPDSFFQVNTKQTINLYNKVLEYANPNPNENILDLYCGTGTIGLFLSKRVKQVYGIEINPYAIKDANENKILNKILNTEFICDDATKLINKDEKKYDTIIVDPPRSGLTEESVNQMKKINSKKIIYVSCDPITMSRDIKQLSEKYDLVEVTPVDMFPNTYHVETVVLLSQQKPSDKIEVDLDLDELDATSAEMKATYAEIKDYVLKEHGLKVSSLYISQVKRKCGLEVGENYNLAKSEDAKQPNCPEEKEKAIVYALKHFGMVS